MSDPEQFLSRWSRLKREAADEPATPTEEVGPVETSSPPDREEAKAAATDAPPPFDPASLPPIESITADSDIRAFFSPGVPADLVRAALRRAWTADPQIRDFVGLSENAWDFTAPDGVPGFGPLEMTNELRQLASQTLDEIGRAIDKAGPLPEEPTQPPESARLSNTAAAAGKPAEEMAALAGQDQPSERKDNQDKKAVGDDPTALPIVDTALQHNSDALQYTVLPTRRTHGRALPE
jgi:hypothetical protein